MSAPENKLDPKTHARILREEIIPQSGLNKLASHEKPRAIILAGQPGSGKGGLVRAARIEFANDILSIDPDELRSAHPRVREFQNQRPYTWSGDTHTDASQWAKGLRSAAVDGRKNIIIDTTLGNGASAVDMVKELQAKGYSVEVRAIAAHRSESELGVDKRFADKLNVDGYGRYVPEEVRAKVYDALPNNLDLVQRETGIPVRIFNREGAQLYDSRASTVQPGVALQEAREARLKDPNITRGLRDGWREQQTWHRNLPETLPQNPKVTPSTGRNLLTERSAGNIVDGVGRNAIEAVSIDHATRIQPTRIRAGTALGVAGLALDAYDAAEAYRTSSRLRSEGNNTAADSQLVHFGSRAVGGWAGFGLGFAAGAAAGVETGPGLIVTGVVGGIAGTFAGEKIAQWTDNQKIYSQNDRQGNTWTFEPENPSLGWRRQAPIDDINDNINNAKRGYMRASPALANQLNYKATSKSVELVLGSPPVPRDPFTQAANAKDSASITTANWTLDSNSNEWRRKVALAYAERGLTPTRIEVANPERAAELNRAAAATVLQNIGNTPAAIAARYEQAHIQNGWAAYGEVPEAAQKARTDVNTLIASDSNRYQRRENGEWVSEGMVYNSTASGNVRAELNATREVLQAVLPPRQAIQAPPPVTDEARLRDTVMGAYQNANVTPSAERIAESAAAVRATWVANGLDINTTALQLKPDANGRYGVNSPIASLRLEGDGRTYRIAAITSTQEILRSGRQPAIQPTQPAAPPKTNRQETPPTATPTKSSQLKHPEQTDHPFHPVYRQASALVEKEDQKQGRTPDGNSERFALAATALAANNNIKRIDNMVFSVENKERGLKAGENVIIMQGGLNDPAHVRAHMKTVVAINTPVEQSLQQLDVAHQRQQQAPVLALQQNQNRDEPSKRALSIG